MRSREEVLREFIGVYIGSATVAEKEMADRIRELEAQTVASDYPKAGDYVPRGEAVAWAWEYMGELHTRPRREDLPNTEYVRDNAFPLYRTPPVAAVVSEEMVRAFRNGFAKAQAGYWLIMLDKYVRAGLEAALTAARGGA